jgi:hypothetical protein
LTAEDVAFGVNQLIVKTMDHVSCFRNGEPKILLITPPPTGPLKPGSVFEYMFKGSEETSKYLAKHYATVAGWYGIPVIDAGQYIASSQHDGIHLDLDAHEKLGQVVAEEVKKILG